MHPERSWFEHLPVKMPALRLYCFPHAGGGADMFRGWQEWLPEWVQVSLAHLPGHGRGMGEECFRELHPLVSAIASRIELQENIPYVLYGHSMGALISFELARELARRQMPGPELLVVSGRRAPQCPRDEPVSHNLPHDQFLAELKRLNGTPREVLENPELMELFIEILRADFQLVETYQCFPGEPLRMPIVVYGGRDDEHLSAQNCQDWQEQTRATATVRMFPGDHFFVRNPCPDFIRAFRTDLLSALRSGGERDV
jgi:medium-chain acyl-[acyl-carrier-protein] hydrolase